MRQLLVAALLPALLSVVPAQIDGRAAQQVIGQGCGLHDVDGTLWGIGSAYKASFRANGVEFTPVLGRRAPHNLPIAFSLEAVGRGNELHPVGVAEPRQHELQVRYDRPACSERYDVRADGVMQSFVFEQLPAGTGDLVVRLRLQTELPLAAATADGLRFELPEIGGVSIGAVTGIDRNDRRCPGTITYDGAFLELRLPADFVEHAALPLVVDPLIGALFNVSPVGINCFDAHVATLTEDSVASLCVFVREVSIADYDVVGQRIGPTGNLQGGLLSLAVTTGSESDPAVAAMTNRGYYVVVYVISGDIRARPVSSLGAVGTAIAVASGTDEQARPCLSGERTAVDDEALCVFHNVTQNALHAQQITCSATGVLTALATVSLASVSSFGDGPRQRISRHGGEAGRHLIVYSQTPVLSATNTYAILVNRNLGVLDTATVTTTGGRRPDVDGNGNEWVIAYGQSSGAGDSDVQALLASFSTQTNQLSLSAQAAVANIVSTDEEFPAVGCVGASCLVGWTRAASPGSTDLDLFLKTVDRFTCAQCEPTQLIVNTTVREHALDIAGSALANGGEGAAIVVYQRSTGVIILTTSSVHGWMFDARDGDVADVLPATGCGQGGRATAACARVGNAAFRLRLRSARPSVSSWTVLSPSQTTLGCGTCVLVADPYAGFFSGPFATDAQGHAEHGIPIPNNSALINASLVAQWIVSGPGGACAAFNIDLSTAIVVTID